MSRRWLVRGLLALGLMSVSSATNAYDLITHAQISQRGFDVSVGLKAYFEDVGVNTNDIFDPDRSARQSTAFAGFVNSGTLRDWLGAGAIREDDYQRHPIFEAAGCRPPRNPSSQVDRPLNHFFDVQRGGGGLAVAPGGGLSAPDWALGLQGRGPNADQNRFSILDARIYQLAFLTGSTRVERERNMALLFRTLGQVTHVLQDMAQPQHTRNDPHAGCLEFLGAGEHSWYEIYLERRARGRTFRTRGDVAPPLRLDGYDPVRFGAYRDFWANAQGSGLAEFSSRNFFSAGTNLSFRNVLFGSLLGGCGGLPEPPCRLDAYRAQPTAFSVRSIDGTTLAGTVTLYRRDMTDPVTGAAIADVAVSSRSLWDQHLETLQVLPSFTLNTLNYDSISDVLLPRAVGYSAGLLDYFFRGKLDVSIQFDDTVDPTTGERDPRVRKLSGKNASGETLGPGTITILAEDLASGERGQVLQPDGSGELGEVSIGPIANLAPIVSDALGSPIRFRPAFPAERYVVVFKGDLGQEKQGTGFIGAVAAKVMGGDRAEGIVSGDKPVLRTPQGTFNLPPAADGLDRVQWGDRTNTFVGVVSLDAANVRPDIVKAFRIPRPDGSTDVPVAPQPDGTQVVPLETLKSVTFPFGVDLATVVTWSHEKRFKQTLITYDVTDTLVYQGDDPNTGGAIYAQVSKDIGAPALEIVVTQTVTLNRSIPLVLDQAHLLDQPGPPPRPYGWRITDLGLDAQNRLLAVVEVKLTSLESQFAFREIGLRSRDRDCQMQDRGSYALGAGFPISNVATVLLDVETGQALGTTGTPTIAPHTVEDEATSVLQVKSIVTYVGGPLAGTEAHCFDTSYVNGNLDYATQNKAVLAVPPVGVTGQTISGWYRSDLDGLVATSVQGTATFSDTQLVYFVDSDAGINYAVTLSGSASHLTGYLTHVREGLRIRPATTANPQVMLRFARPVGKRLEEGEEAVLVQWSPMNPAESRLAIPQELPAALYALKGATPQAATLLSEDGFGGASTLLVDLGSGTVRPPYPGDLSRNFVLLAPELLYNINDTQYYTLNLEQTALPLPLADGPTGPQPLADFHVIRVTP